MTSVTPADLPAAVGSAGSSAALAGPSPVSSTAAVALGLDDARRMTLRAQGFVGASARKGGVPGMLRRVGGVQLDTISVLARSHELVAYARLGAIPRDRIERAYWNPAHPSAFEYWAHAACVLPIEEWPYYAFRRRWFRARGMRWHEVSPQVCAEVLAQVRTEGPLTATQLGGAKGGGPWWDWSAVKVAAEWLLDIGELVCVRRAGWRRVYDLPERVVPAELLAAEPSDEECVSHLVGVAARALGVATHADLTDYHRLQRRLPAGSGRAAALDDAARAAGLTPVTIPGPRGRPGRVGRPGRARRRRRRPPGASPGHAAVAVRLAHLGPEADGPAVRLRAQPGGLRAEGQARARLLRDAAAGRRVAWSAGWIRSGGAGPWSPARFPWTGRRPPGRWPARCGRRRNGSAVIRSR